MAGAAEDLRAVHAGHAPGSVGLTPDGATVWAYVRRAPRSDDVQGRSLYVCCSRSAPCIGCTCGRPELRSAPPRRGVPSGATSWADDRAARPGAAAGRIPSKSTPEGRELQECLARVREVLLPCSRRCSVRPREGHGLADLGLWSRTMEKGARSVRLQALQIPPR